MGLVCFARATKQKFSSGRNSVQPAHTSVIKSDILLGSISFAVATWGAFAALYLHANVIFESYFGKSYFPFSHCIYQTMHNFILQAYHTWRNGSLSSAMVIPLEMEPLKIRTLEAWSLYLSRHSLSDRSSETMQAFKSACNLLLLTKMQIDCFVQPPVLYTHRQNKLISFLSHHRRFSDKSSRYCLSGKVKNGKVIVLSN